MDGANAMKLAEQLAERGLKAAIEVEHAGAELRINETLRLDELAGLVELLREYPDVDVSVYLQVRVR